MFYKTNGSIGGSTTVLFWGKKSCGYTSNIDEAEIYSLEQMQEEVDKGWFRNDFEIPLSVPLVNELAQWRVDSQLINLKASSYPHCVDPNGEYVAVKKNAWSGNDLAFSSSDLEGRSYNYSEATVFSENDAKKHTKPDVDNGWWIIPKYLTDEIARRTFQATNINRRAMISGAGIVGLKKKPVRKPSSGKTRMNCPACGRINWQYNPYDFEGCSNQSCDEHNYLLR
ncbi:TPA: hypothetical protein L3N15_004169 [Vibrio parahaemolyticus]|nr:hypothetical protein [Vibrio parahaemolyticus]